MISWLLLILTIPGRKPAWRMRVWRKLKLLGAGVLRDGVYVCPAREDLRTELAALADEVVAAGGTAKLLQVSVQDDDFPSLFDREAEYRALIKEATAAARSFKGISGAQATRRAEQLRRELEAIAKRDFFTSPLQAKSREALEHLQAIAARRGSPDEPHAARARIQKLDVSQYQGRTWATRAKPWVDRLASAWLIKRFIDPKAKFAWLKDVKSQAARRQLTNGLGFDFDGAPFTHVGDKVTFEVLMASFNLEQDPALQRLGAVVHYLDLGGLPVPEASTIESILRGMQERARDDDRLFAEARVLFDDLYAGYSREASAI